MHGRIAEKEHKKTMKARKYRLNVWISPRTATLVVGRLYGCGEITRAQYNHFMRKIDGVKFAEEERRNKKFEKIMAKIRGKRP